MRFISLATHTHIHTRTYISTEPLFIGPFRIFPLSEIVRLNVFLFISSGFYSVRFSSQTTRQDMGKTSQRQTFIYIPSGLCNTHTHKHTSTQNMPLMRRIMSRRIALLEESVCASGQQHLKKILQQRMYYMPHPSAPPGGGWWQLNSFGCSVAARLSVCVARRTR